MTFFNQIEGLKLGLDRRQPAGMHTLEGQNFLVDAEGPHSAFGTELITYTQLRNAAFSETFRVGSKIFLFITNAVLEFDTVAQLYYPVLVFPETVAEFPWSHAIVANKHYFLKLGTNVLEFNPFTNEWAIITANVPVNAAALTASAGRLCIAGQFDLAWSDIDDGSSLAPDDTRGTGIQSLAIVGDGAVLAILPTFDGFITYTATGAMKSEIVDSLLAFRHYPLTGGEDFLPLSPYTIIEGSRNQHLMLTKTGFYTTQGKVPEQFQPLASEFFRRKILPRFDLTNQTLFRLTFNSDRQWFLVSIAESEQQFRYNFAYVLYVPRDEWGLFKRNHTGFGELSLTDGPFKGFNFGYFCFNGCLHRFADFPRIEQHLDGADGSVFPDTFYYFHDNFEIPARVENGVYHFTSIIQMTTIDETPFAAVGTSVYSYGALNSYVSPDTFVEVEQGSDFGTPNVFRSDIFMQGVMSELGWKQYTALFGSIDAEIIVGLLRGQTEQEFPDAFTSVYDVEIGMSEVPSGQIFDDWALTAPDVFEDWLTGTFGNEDWGAGVFSGTVYKTFIIGSLEGYTQFEDQFEQMQERTDIVRVAATTGRARFFDCNNSGIYHMLKITAVDVGESFHLKTIDTALIPSGRA